MSLVEALEFSVSAKNSLAFMTKGLTPTRLTSEELWQEAGFLAGMFVSSGVFDPGEQVVIPRQSQLAGSLLFLATIRAGLVPRIDWRLRPEASPAATGVDRPTPRSELSPTVYLAESIDESFVGCILPDGTHREFGKMGEWRRYDSPMFVDDAETPVFAQFTSGTTADRERVLVTGRALLANVTAIQGEGLGLSPLDVSVSWLPLGHDMGLVGKLLVPLLTGMNAVFLEPTEFMADPLSWPRAIDAVGATVSFAPNFAYELISALIPPDSLRLDSWRIAGFGGEIVRPETLDRFVSRYQSYGLPGSAPTPCYGMAECVLGVSFGASGTEPRRVAIDGGNEAVSCGRALPGMTVSIGEPVDGFSEHAGRVVVEGDSLLSSDKSGVLVTEDIGFVHENELYILGRTQDVIVVRGRSVSADKIETVLSEELGLPSGRFAVLVAESNDGTDLPVVVGQDPETYSRLLAARASGGLGATMLYLSGVGDVEIGLADDGFPRTTSGKLRRSAIVYRLPEDRRESVDDNRWT